MVQGLENAHMDAQEFIRRSIRVVRIIADYQMKITSESDLEEISRLLDESCSVIGTGKHEFYKNKQEFLQGNSNSDYDASDVEFEVMNEAYHGQLAGDDTCIVYGQIWVREKDDAAEKLLTIDMDTRFSVVLRRYGDDIKAVHVHHSLPNADQMENEFFPKTLAARANEVLRYSKELEERVDRDVLCKVYNRAAMERKVNEYLTTQRGEYAFLMLDVDNFKQINDRYGHPAGDVVLKDIAALLKKLFGEDALVGRIGVDEFCIFIPGEHACKEVIKRADLIIEGCEQLSRSANKQISCSVGVVHSSEPGSTFLKLFQKADKELYKSKAAGKNRCSFGCDFRE